MERQGDAVESLETKIDPVICVVDDDESVRRALRRLIGSLGMRVETFPSPGAFLDRDRGEPISCLLLDVRLPEMDGFELLERTLEAGIDSPVIFITAHPDDRTRARASRTDAVAFLEKPIDVQALLKALEAALDHPERR